MGPLTKRTNAYIESYWRYSYQVDKEIETSAYTPCDERDSNLQLTLMYLGTLLVDARG